MEDTIVIREFGNLARRLGINIRYTNEGPSGLCTIKDKKVLFIDKTLDKRNKIEVFTREFKTLDIEGVFVVPVIRRLLELNDEANGW